MRIKQVNFICLTFFIFLIKIKLSKNGVNGSSIDTNSPTKRALQESHEKSITQKRMDVFFRDNQESYQELSLAALVGEIGKRYLAGCTSIILYDNFTEHNDRTLLEVLFKTYPIAYLHGQITDDYKIVAKNLLTTMNTCVNYVLFLKDVMRCRELIGDQSFNKVVVVARSSQWRVYEFLADKFSQSFVNLLVIAQTARAAYDDEAAYILFTHKLYTDALGSSTHQVLTSWRYGRFTRPHISLFPNKITEGFSGFRFITSVGPQAPFVIKKSVDENDDVQWDGIEIRLVQLLAEIHNFSLEFKEAPGINTLGSAEAVTNVVKRREAHLGIAGIYITQNRIDTIEASVMHTQDCAAFISLTSTALPRYRAIMGPFHWTVWLALIFIYLFAIFPISFSDKHTLRPLLRNPEEIENMFWYVFGTFTNAFSFLGKKSWSQSDKMATRLFIGFYWLFTIIITACYTGSIIAFVTLPIFPETVDTATQLLNGKYRIGTLDRDGWPQWFENSSDPIAQKLLKNMDLVPRVEDGLKNTTKAFFWAYAFLGSRAQLDYIVRTNFTTTSKRSLLHISDECFVPFGIGVAYRRNALYTRILDYGVQKIVQSGFMEKIKNDVEFMMMRSATGKLLSNTSPTYNQLTLEDEMVSVTPLHTEEFHLYTFHRDHDNNTIKAFDVVDASTGTSIKALSVEDRALTLDDTQGMFLLLALGFILGGASLVSEWLGGCVKFCKRQRSDSNSSIASNPRSHDAPTPREKLDSIQYSHTILNQRNSLQITEDGEVVHRAARNSARNSVEQNHTAESGLNHIDKEQAENDPDNNVNESLESLDYDTEIDQIFDFAHIFGEATSEEEEHNTINEEIIERIEEDVTKASYHKDE